MRRTSPSFPRILILCVAAALWPLSGRGLTASAGNDSIAPSAIPAAPTGSHAVSTEHPRLLGSRARLQDLARQQPQVYQRVEQVARVEKADEHSKIVSLSLVSAIEQDRALGRQAIELAKQTIRAPIKTGHDTFGHDLARCAIAYDLCYEYWTEEERAAFHDYMNRTVDANVNSETHVFHNAWYGYKNWGFGLACYATFYENPRAVEILRTLEQDYLTRAAPALELAGAGGGWAEGYYINYWLYEWLFFCESARWCEGVDYYAAAPGFYRARAVASMFETYPGIGTYGSRRSIPMGDGGGRTFGGDRDKILSARRMLVNFFREDPDHQAVQRFNESTPRSSVGAYAYKDLLWRDPTVASAELKDFRLSHFSAGPGYVYARSSWDEDATYFFFKCGNRFTAHQHLDVGNFLVYRHEELIGDGGHYDGFGTRHDVNYHLRTVAHNAVLIYDPAEKWPSIRSGNVTGNDGGQSHNWPHHNGAVADPAGWEKDRNLYEIGKITAFADHNDYLYVAGDCSRAYSPKKLDYWTRQIVYVRPGTFVVFDRVATTRPELAKTWLLQSHAASGNPRRAAGNHQRQRAALCPAPVASAETDRVEVRRRSVPLRRPGVSARARYRAGAGVPRGDITSGSQPSRSVSPRVDRGGCGSQCGPDRHVRGQL